MNLSPEHKALYFKRFLIIIAMSALSSSIVMVVLSNYLKAVYHVDALQRGLIKLPRELPGVLAIFIIALLVGYSNITIAIIAQALAITGVAVLGFFKPPYVVMLGFVFLNSLGHHLLMPINDSLSISLSKDDEMGRNMGAFKGVYTAFAMVASTIVFIGFRYDIFSFDGPWITVFLVSAVAGTLALILYLDLFKRIRNLVVPEKKLRFVYRSQYKLYYALVILYGLQKQIMLVYSPWVLISYFSKGPDTLAMLTIIGSFIGMIFIPKLGVWVDQFGIKRLLYVDAWSFVAVYLAFGLAISAIEAELFQSTIVPLIIIYVIFILDKMSNQMGLIRTLYLKSIARDPADVTTTLSLGLALDHVVSISAAILAGVIWAAFGAQYIFFALAAISLLNVYIAHRVNI